MFTLININSIIHKHYKTLNEDSKWLVVILIFLLIPLVISGVPIHFNKMLTSNSINSLITAYSIFTALLLNVIFIIYDIVKDNPRKKLHSDDISGNIKNNNIKSLIEHLYANSLYALLISIIILVLLFCLSIVEIWDITNCDISKFSFNPLKWVSYLTYLLVAHFMMNLIMITKRLSVLLFNNFEEEQEPDV